MLSVNCVGSFVRPHAANKRQSSNVLLPLQTTRILDQVRRIHGANVNSFFKTIDVGSFEFFGAGDLIVGEINSDWPLKCCDVLVNMLANAGMRVTMSVKKAA